MFAFIVFPLENVSRGFFLSKFEIKSEKFEKICHKKCLEKVSGKSPESFPESLPIWVKLYLPGSNLGCCLWASNKSWEVFWLCEIHNVNIGAEEKEEQFPWELLESFQERMSMAMTRTTEWEQLN